MCKKHGRASRQHNGHPSRSLASVTNALTSDPRLYRMSAAALRCTHNKDAAARYIAATLAQQGIDKTADGVAFTRSAIRYALRHI